MKTILCVLSAFVALQASAGTPVADGVRLYFSPRGQAYFKENLETVLKKNGLDLTKNHWDEIKFDIQDPMNEQKLPSGFRASQGERFKAVRARLGSFFFGFPINPPHIEAKMLGNDLPVKFQSMGAEVDKRGPDHYGKKSGVVILLRLEAEEVKFSSSTIRLDDLANPGFFGVMGVDKLSSTAIDGSRRPVKVEIPVHVDTNEKGATMEILSVRTNLQKTPFAAQFDKLHLPTITLTVNGKEYSFDKTVFERELRAMLPDLSDLMIGAVKSYFEKGGKELIQPSFDDLAKDLNIDFELGLAKRPKDDISVSLRPMKTFYTKSNHLGLAFSAEVPETSRKPTVPTGSSSEPKLAEVDADTYDVSLAIHPAALNTVLEKAWKRGLLKDVEIGKDESGRPEIVKLPKAPVVSFTGLSATNLANIHATIGYSVRGIGRILFKGPIPIELDLQVKLETNSKNEIEIVLDQINEKTLKVDTRATWLFPIRAMVDKMVREKLTDLNKTIKTKRTQMTSLPTLNDLIKIPLHLDTAKTDSGNLILFADFVN